MNFNQQYNYNGQWLPFSELPADLQQHIALEKDFWQQINAANHDQEKIAQICATHPYNN